MRERSPQPPSSLFVRASLLVGASALAYFGTLELFPRPESIGPWLGPAWIALTYGVVGAVFLTRSRPRRVRERRKVSRIPVALPVRYSTEEGEVGVGVLVDLTSQGAGLLVPQGAVDADRVWLQFLGFDDHHAVQGRIAYAQPADGATRLGLTLDPLHSQTRRLLTEFVIPLGYETLIHLRARVPNGFASPFSRFKHGRHRTERRYHLPVLVEQGTTQVWAVTQAATEDGAVLLLPQNLPSNIPVRICTWGQQNARQCSIVKSEVLSRGMFQISRVIVRYDSEPTRII